MKISQKLLALKYARLGLHVLPLHAIADGHCSCGSGADCKRPGKHPRTPNGVKDATTDRSAIKAWWNRWPKAKVGLVLGAPSNVIAVETRGKTGRRKLRELTHGSLLRTVTIQSRNRRLHLYRVQGNQPRSVELRDGVRILGEGEIIVAASPSSTGTRRFANGRALGEIEIARAPDWLIADLTSAEDDDGHAGSEDVEGEAKTVPFHQFANIFPMLPEERLHELAENIKERGLVDDIILYEGRILDGRCRYLACQIAGVELKFQEYVGDDPLGLVVSRNLHRRHLTESQRAMVATRLADLKRGANQHSQGLPIGRAADLLNVGERSVARARGVLQRGVPELVQAVERGEVAVSAAADISGMPESEQRETLAPVSGGSTNADGETGIKKARKSAMRKTGKSKKQAAGVAGDMAPAGEVEKLKDELAAATERQRELEKELQMARAAASRARAIDGSTKAPAADEDIPAFLDRRPLSPDDQAVWDAVMAAWANSTALRAVLVGVSPVFLERFIAAVRADISANSAPN
jgi:hypothetical protein